MADPLTAQDILDSAEQVLRRYGPAKTTVVDVARDLRVSHGSVYRHFTSKAALRDAVTRRWLQRISAPLHDVVSGPGAAADRLRAWVRLLAATKQGMAADDPELFATFQQVTAEASDVVAEHVDDLSDQLGRIIADGVAAAELTTDDPRAAGRAVLQATAYFHHPAMAGEWRHEGLAAQLEAVLDVVVDGLRSVGAVRTTEGRARS